MSDCEACGAEILDGDLFCAECGAAVADLDDLGNEEPLGHASAGVSPANTPAGGEGVPEAPPVLPLDDDQPTRGVQSVADEECSGASHLELQIRLDEAIHHFAEGAISAQTLGRIEAELAPKIALAQGGVDGDESLTTAAPAMEVRRQPGQKGRIVLAALVVAAVVVVISISQLVGGGESTIPSQRDETEYTPESTIPSQRDETEYMPESPVPQEKAFVVDSVCKMNPPDANGSQFGFLTLIWSDGTTSGGGTC